MMNQKFKLSTIFSLISSFILLILGIVGLIYFASQERFILFFEDLMNQPIDLDGTTLRDTLTQIGSMDYIAPLMYIIFIVFSIYNIISAIVCLILSFICLKDHQLSCKDFERRKRIHIAYIVFVAIGWFSFDCAVGSLISSILSLLSTAASILYIIAFIFAIIGLRYNTKRFDELTFNNLTQEEINKGTERLRSALFNENQGETKEDLIQDDSNQKELNDEWIEQSQEDVDDGNNNQKDEKEEAKPTIDNEKLNQTYELLAKLEKSHRNQEISDEDYERMKKTIMDNLLK